MVAEIPIPPVAPQKMLDVQPDELPVPGLDPVAAQRWANWRRSLSPWLHEEVGQRMAERLQWIKQRPRSWLNWEPVHGGMAAHEAVRQALPESKVFVASAHWRSALSTIEKNETTAQVWWAKLRGRAPSPADESTKVALVWANMGLHASHQPQTLLRRWHRHLETDGFLMFSCLGPDSLKELAAVYAQMGWPAPSHAFTDMHDWGDMLVNVGFAEPVMDAETITLTYSSVNTLLADLRTLGRNLHTERDTTTRGRGWLTQLHEALQRHLPRTPDGQMRLTFEVIYGHAYKPKPSHKVAPTSAVSLSDMRNMLAAPRPPGKS